MNVRSLAYLWQDLLDDVLLAGVRSEVAHDGAHLPDRKRLCQEGRGMMKHRESMA